MHAHTHTHTHTHTVVVVLTGATTTAAHATPWSHALVVYTDKHVDVGVAEYDGALAAVL